MFKAINLYLNLQFTWLGHSVSDLETKDSNFARIGDFITEIEAMKFERPTTRFICVVQQNYPYTILKIIICFIKHTYTFVVRVFLCCRFFVRSLQTKILSKKVK